MLTNGKELTTPPMPKVNKKREMKLKEFLCHIGLEPAASKHFNISPIHEALCHSSAGLKQNHELMEFLGDAVLRLAAAEYLEDYKPNLSVGERSALRAQLVSDRWLSELAEKINLDFVIETGAAAASDINAIKTIRAECCEALVGGIYLAWGGPNGGTKAVRQWLDPQWEVSCEKFSADPHLYNWKSALQEWSQAEKGVLPNYVTEEKNSSHGNPERFRSRVAICEILLGEGLGPSRRLAEQDAARKALEQLRPPSGS